MYGTFTRYLPYVLGRTSFQSVEHHLSLNQTKLVNPMQGTYTSLERPTRAPLVRRPHMGRYDLGMGFFVVMWSVSFAWCPALAADPMAQHVEHPFRNLAAWLRAVSPDLGSVETKTISRGITVLSNSQNYVKSLDGMGNEIKGTISRASSTADIETGDPNRELFVRATESRIHEQLRQEAELYESKSTRKEVKKLLNLLVVVENALNSAEVAEIAAQRDPAVRARYMEDAGLELLPEMKFAPASAVRAGVPGGDADGAEVEQLAPDGDPSGGKASSKGGSGRGESIRRRKTPLDAPRRSRLVTGVGSEDDKAGFSTELAGSRDEKPLEALSVPNLSDSSPSVAAPGGGAASRAGRGGKGVTAASKSKSRRSSKQAWQQTASGAKPPSGKNMKKKRALAEEHGTSRRADSDEDETIGRGNEEKSGMLPEVGDPLEAFVARVEGTGEDGEVRCLLMVDKRDRRFVLAVGDGLVGEALMRSLNEDPAVVRLASRGSMHEVLYVNRAVFQAACDILEWAGRHIKASMSSGPFEGYSMHCVGHSFGGAVAACVAGMLEGTIDVEVPGSGSSSRSATRDRLRGGGGQGTKQGSSHTGREGRGSRSSSRGLDKSPGGAAVMEGNGEGRQRGVRVAGASPWVGICGDKVTCVTLGCPPCLSHNLELSFVTSLVLGDDMVPRTSHESLRRLKRRLLQVIPKRKDLLSQGMAFGTSLFTDVAGVTMQGLRKATTSSDDDARLTVPGSVWFMKPRRLNNGATMEKVKRGSLRGDMLWQLQDIVLTKSMMSHHRLHRYIEVLDRV